MKLSTEQKIFLNYTLSNIDECIMESKKIFLKRDALMKHAVKMKLELENIDHTAANRLSVLNDYMEEGYKIKAIFDELDKALSIQVEKLKNCTDKIESKLGMNEEIANLIQDRMKNYLMDRK